MATNGVCFLEGKLCDQCVIFKQFWVESSLEKSTTSQMLYVTNLVLVVQYIFFLFLDLMSKISTNSFSL